MGKKSSQGQAVESADTTRAQNPLSDADGAQAARKQRSPAAHQGIQVNFCKNPICANFGSPVGDKLSRSQNPYRIVASGKGLPVGYCQSCNESFPLKSNKGIYEELERMLAFLVDATAQPCCPVDGCSIRRRQSLLERSISSQSNTGRVWSGYAPYSPNQVQKLLDILRVVQNYVLKGTKDKKTPVMRLGLAKGPVKYEDILYFTGP